MVLSSLNIHIMGGGGGFLMGAGPGGDEWAKTEIEGYSTFLANKLQHRKNCHQEY